MPIKELADSGIIVYSVYAAAFIPLAFIHGLDFITEKWRTIHDTRRNGMIQLCISVPCLAYVLFYIFLQVKHNDHKEAAAAITVAVFNTYHVLRSVWGLIQLYEFTNWNIRALTCLIKLGYPVPECSLHSRPWFKKNPIPGLWNKCTFWRRASPTSSDGSESTTSSDGTESYTLAEVSDVNYAVPYVDAVTKLWAKLRTKCMSVLKGSSTTVIGNVIISNKDYASEKLINVKRTVDRLMVVNNSLIDNEFTSTVLPIRAVLFNRSKYERHERHSLAARLVASVLKSKVPEECSVRWVVSFLAKFGHTWLVDTRRLEKVPENGTEETERLFLSRSVAVLAASHKTHGKVTSDGSTKNFVSLFSPFHEYCIAPHIYCPSTIDVGEENPLPFKGKGCENGKLNFRDQEATIKDAVRDDWDKTLLNKLGDEERTAVENVSAVQLACFSKLMIQDPNFSVNFNPHKYAPLRESLHKRLVGILMYQIGCDSENDVSEFAETLPWGHALRYENDLHPVGGNGFALLQESFHIENYIALDNGEKLEDFLAGLKPIYTQDADLSVFQRQYDLETSRLQWDVGNIEKKDTGRFIGCAIELVRSTLAKWVEDTQCDSDGWMASVSTDKLSFTCSKQLCSACTSVDDVKFVHSFNMRLAWEVQSFLQWKIQREVELKEGDLRNSRALIMLFILGFPSLCVKQWAETSRNAVEEDGSNVIDFPKRFIMTPVGGPQDVRIAVELNVESEQMTMWLEVDSGIFKWQDWKDAFMGRMCAQKEWRLSRMISEHESFDGRAKEVKLSDPVDGVCGNARGKLIPFHIWLGWPPYSPQIALFELGHLWFVKEEGVEDLKNALENHFQSNNVDSPSYLDGISALQDGREEEALEIFRGCIVDEGHEEALEHSINICLKNIPELRSKLPDVHRSMSSNWWVGMHGINIPAFDGVKIIDFGRLASCSGRVFEATRIPDFGVLKAYCLFYQDGPINAVSDEAIIALEQVIPFLERNNYPAAEMRLHLALGHLSVYMETGDAVRRHLAGTAMLHYGLSFVSGYPEDGVCVSPFYIGYFLRKGFCVSRDKPKIARLLSTETGRFGRGDHPFVGKRLERTFVKLFVEEEQRDQSSIGIGKHPEYALQVFEAILAKGLQDEQMYNQIGLIHHLGGVRVPVNTSEAEKNYSKAIDLGSSTALSNMAVLRNGNQAEGNDVPSLESAITNEDSTAMNNLAVAYDLGNGVERNAERAEELYKQAIDKDQHPIALFNLAVMYKCGDAGIRNEEKSKKFMKRLRSPETDTSGLHILRKQIMKFRIHNLRSSELGDSIPWTITLEEVEDCLAYLKVIEDE